MDPLLFTPFQLRGLTLRNRIVVSPMLTYSAVNGFPVDFHSVHYGKLAMGGAGLVIVESTKVDHRGCTTPHDLGLWKDDFVAPLKKIVDLVHSYGAAVGIQLGHSGRKARNSAPWQGRKQLEHHEGVEPGETWELIGPSPKPHGSGYHMPREVTTNDIDDLLQKYAAAARRADQAGFDVFEIHVAHGYLLHQFLSADANERTDKYGGSVENRMRFPLEVIDAVRSQWPQTKPLFIRISAVDETGLTVEDSARFAAEAEKRGVDLIDCSSGGMSGKAATQLGYGYQVPFARDIKRLSGVKTMAVGHIIHADQAESILQAGDADLVAIGREFLHNPNWPIDAAQKLGIEKPFAGIPANYAYWLNARFKGPFQGTPSTWQSGIGKT